MMRVVSLLLALSLLSAVAAQEGDGGKESEQEERIPTTLAEAHVRLEQMLSAEELAKIDAMPSEEGMSDYHFGLGMSIRNGWGLWQGLALAKHMQELGFTHADDMSGVILATLWCKRHGQDFRLKERAAKYKKHWDEAKKAQEDAENRAREGNAAIQNMMMGLQFEKRDVPVVRMRIGEGPSVRFSCPFRDGVFLTACQRCMRRVGVTTEPYYVDLASGEICRRPLLDRARGLYAAVDCQWYEMKPAEDYYTVGCYLDLEDGKIHRIRVAEVNDVHAAVVADDRAWFAGMTDEKPILVGVGDRDRLTVPLPQSDEIPDLGLDGQSLLAVYSKTVYRLADGKWTLVHSGDIVLPRSGLPPQRHGNMVFLCDENEGMPGGQKRLWWLTMGEKPRLHLLARDTGLFEPIVEHGPDWTHIHGVGPGGWEATSSYCVTGSGDLWASVAGGSYLLRRAQDGTYACAIADGSLEFVEEPSDSKRADQGLSVTGATALPDDSLLLVGSAGLYRLRDNELAQVLAFAPEETPDSRGRVARRLYWSPTSVLALDDGSYVISTSRWDGVYWLRLGDDGQWTCLRAGEGDPVVW